MILRHRMLGSDLLAAGATPNRWTDELTIYDHERRRWRSWLPVGAGPVYEEIR